MSDDMPIASIYKGVGIHAGQPPKRVARIKREIDRVARTQDLVRLSVIADDCSWSPEARMYAGARCIAGLQRATERREPRPSLEVDKVVASTCSLMSIKWRNPFAYCSLLDAWHDSNAVEREQPLTAD